VQRKDVRGLASAASLRILTAIRTGHDCDWRFNLINAGGEKWVAKPAGIRHCDRHPLSALSILMDGHGVDFGVPRKPQVDFGELGGIGEGKTA
jgi:hypothetical protein